MTDNEIIKALECCTDEWYENCNECPYSIDTISCERMKLLEDSLDLINRQKAEIIRLQSMNQAKIDTIHDLQSEIEELKINLSSMRMAANSYKMHYKYGKSEAINEFAERLVYTLCINNEENTEVFDYAYTLETIDNLVKEMVGENNRRNDELS